MAKNGPKQSDCAGQLRPQIREPPAIRHKGSEIDLDSPQASGLHGLDQCEDQRPRKNNARIRITNVKPTSGIHAPYNGLKKRRFSWTKRHGPLSQRDLLGCDMQSTFGGLRDPTRKRKEHTRSAHVRSLRSPGGPSTPI